MCIQETASGADRLLNLQLGTEEKSDQRGRKEELGAGVCITHTSLGPLISFCLFCLSAFRELRVQLQSTVKCGGGGGEGVLVYVCICWSAHAQSLFE